MENCNKETLHINRRQFVTCLFITTESKSISGNFAFARLLSLNLSYLILFDVQCFWKGKINFCYQKCTGLGLMLTRVTVMLVTTLCWWFYDGEPFKMLMTKSFCCRFFGRSVIFSIHLIRDHHNVECRNFRTCHQYFLSPTSVTNINLKHCIILKTLRRNFPVIAWSIFMIQLP